MDKNLQKYLAFLESVDTGSFTKAADQLHYTQSGISRMVSDLEQDWNVTLLERNKTGVTLTGDGEKLLPFARAVCSDYQILQAKVDELNGLQTGTIRIGTVSSIATYVLPDIIKRFQQDYPGIEYKLILGDYTEIEAWIADGIVDCGFLRIPTKHAFDAIPLRKDNLLVVLPEDHPLADCAVFPVKELCRFPFLLLGKDPTTEITEIFEHNHIVPDIHFTAWDNYAIMAMVESGLGISIMQELVLTRTPFRIVTKKLDVPAYREIGFIMRNRETASLAVKRFLEYLPQPYSVSCSK